MDQVGSDLNLLAALSSFLLLSVETAEQQTERDALAVNAKKTLRSLFAYAVRNSFKDKSGSELSTTLSKELFVDGFDTEQIWSQFEKFNKWCSQHYRRDLKHLQSEFQLIPDEVEAEIESLFPTQSIKDNIHEGILEQENDVLLNGLSGAKEKESQPPVVNPVGNSVIEDAFLKVHEMGSFLDEAEEEEYGEQRDDDVLGTRGPESRMEDENQLEGSDTDNNEGNEEAGKKQGNEIMYEDIFGSRKRKGDQASNTGLVQSTSPSSSLQEALEQSKKTRIAEERATIQHSIQLLEDEAIGDREWPFRGEVTAIDRPLNSALEVDLDYDTTVKPPPKPTQAHMDSIEDLIRGRIRDRQFDDVERVVPPPIEETKRVVELDDTKAKKGLGEIYENEYKSACGSGTLEEKEEKLRLEARKLFKEACSRLDALTHFHFAPRPVVEEMSVRVNLPAVRMEEPLPVSVNSNTTKAPEEVYNPASKTGETVNANELTKEDKKQMRAKRKRALKTSKQTGSMSKDVKIRGRKSVISHQNASGGKKRKLRDASRRKEKSKEGSSVFRKIQSYQDNKEKEGTEKKATQSYGSSSQLKL